MSNNDHRSLDQAKAQVRDICEMVASLECDYDRLGELREQKAQAESDGIAMDADDLDELDTLEQAAGDCSNEEDAQRRIDEDPLSVTVRSDWCSPGETMSAGEYRILLCTGGPHVELVGGLNQYSEPDSVRVLHADWGSSGEYFPSSDENETLLRYARCFYFGGA